jgi:hypothetical protein
MVLWEGDGLVMWDRWCYEAQGVMGRIMLWDKWCSWTNGVMAGGQHAGLHARMPGGAGRSSVEVQGPHFPQRQHSWLV